MTTLILRDEVFLAHDPGGDNPERAERLSTVLADLDARPVAGTTTAAPRDATRSELHRVHAADHVDRIEATAEQSRVRLDWDTSTSPASWDAARRAAGAVCQAAEAVVSGEVSGAMALVRPPGHHAERARAMGFCLFNNVAVAAAHAVDALGCRRVLVLDPDVHHGNGTQNTFWDRTDVLYVSSHRFPFYPGTGDAGEVGTGDATGYTINLPLPGGCGDEDLLHAWGTVVDPVVHAWRPDLIIVSAGYDTWQHDPLGGMAVTAGGFAALYALFRSWADAHCPGRLVAALEGGYDPAGVVAGVRATLDAFTAGAVAAPDPTGARPQVVEMAERVRGLLAPRWPVLRR